MNLEHAIEALLFWKGEPMSFKEICKSLSLSDKDATNSSATHGKVSEDDVHEALAKLVDNLKGRGIVLMANEDQEYMLGTSNEASAFIEKLTKEELNKDLGKASLETLSIILYQGPIKRSQIDYIRGVNSTFILRNLLIRGLIEKKPAPDDNRTSIYSASFKLLSYLGVADVKDLPNFELVKNEIEKFKTEQDTEVNEPASEQSKEIEQADEEMSTDAPDVQEGLNSQLPTDSPLELEEENP